MWSIFLALCSKKKRFAKPGPGGELASGTTHKKLQFGGTQSHIQECDFISRM
jgi:hypothetical protein